jgi:AcrR family transcriptional regulator
MDTSGISNRQQKAIDVFISAGISAVAETGVDRISVSQVTTLAKATRPTFYSYFGDIDGLLAEIWLTHADQWLADLANPLFSVSAMSKSEQEKWICLTEILAITHRMASLREVVEPMVAAWFKPLSKGNQLEVLKTVWLVATRLGIVISQSIDPKAAEANIIDPLVQHTPNESTVKLEVLKPAALPPIADPKLDQASVENQLIQAAISVIASAGAAAASMTRISRKARLSTGSAYPRFSNSDELVNSSFEVAVAEVVRQNFELVDGGNFGPEDFGLFVTAGLQPPRKTWRNFRVEIHIEGRVNKDLKKRLASSLKATNAAVAKGLTNYNAPELTESAVPYLMHTVGIGFAVLLNAGLPVDKMDHRIVTVEFAKLFGKLKEFNPS